MKLNINTKKIGKWAGNILTVLMLVALLFLMVIVIASKASGGSPKVFGVEFKTVLSGSMEPEFKTGSIIALKPGGDMTRFKEKDIITFLDEDSRLITHRIIEVVESGDNILYKTKGDNNDSADRNLVLSENVVGEYTGFTIPYLGYLINFAQSKNGALLMLLPGLLLLMYAGYTFWKLFNELEGKKKKELVDQNVEIPSDV